MAQQLESNNLEEAFDIIGQDLVKTLIKNLLNANKKATGQLIRSIDYKIIEKVNGLMIELRAANYLTNVDEGRKRGAKQPPTRALDKWISARGITMKDKKGKPISKESAKFLIARSIKRNGIRPTNVIKNTIDEVYNNKQKLIETAAIEDISDLIDKIIIK
jgi:hypothetical protein